MQLDHRPKSVLRIAQALFDQRPNWVTFFREVLGLNGAVRQAFPLAPDLLAFELSQEARDIQAMLAELRQADYPSNDTERLSVVTVRLPAAVHEALKAKARERKTSMNKLCISKLLQNIDEDLVPAEGATAT